METYLKQCSDIIEYGEWKTCRNGRTKFIHGLMSKYDMSTGKFPAVTTKKLYFKSVVAELLGFIRGVSSAEDFRKLGTSIWDEDANGNKQWLASPHRKGQDDLGRIYGVQARAWQSAFSLQKFDQFGNIVSMLEEGKDDRRLIVNHWNPGEITRMALPPCHCFYQVGLCEDNTKINLMMYQRSMDCALGQPFNIASYALLLEILAKITGKVPGIFTHVVFDAHIYEQHIETMLEQIERKVLPSPQLQISNKVTSLRYLEREASYKDFNLVGYEHHPQLYYKLLV